MASESASTTTGVVQQDGSVIGMESSLEEELLSVDFARFSSRFSLVSEALLYVQGELNIGVVIVQHEDEDYRQDIDREYLSGELWLDMSEQSGGDLVRVGYSLESVDRRRIVMMYV
ncbi:hypothetical protein Tco_0789773 [Tanacetum coccineum]